MTVHLEGIEDFSNLQNENKEKLIVIDFFAKWCGPCKRIATAYEELQTVFPNVVFVKVDVDVAEDLTKKFKVRLFRSMNPLKTQMKTNLMHKWKNIFYW